MSNRRLAWSQLWVASGVAVFCIGGVIIYDQWWVRAVFGLLGLFAVWLVSVFIVYLRSDS